jgi:hypothetical protein
LTNKSKRFNRKERIGPNNVTFVRDTKDNDAGTAEHAAVADERDA